MSLKIKEIPGHVKNIKKCQVRFQKFAFFGWISLGIIIKILAFRN